MENKPQREKGWKKSSVGTATERRPRGTAERGGGTRIGVGMRAGTGGGRGVGSGGGREVGAAEAEEIERERKLSLWWVK